MKYFFLIIFFSANILIAKQENKSLPPYTRLVKTNKVITQDNFGTSYHFWPFNWYQEGYPVAYNVTPGDYRDDNPFGNENLELLNQYESATWFRNFYPNDAALWNKTDGLALNSLQWFLRELDFHHTNGKKVLWSAELFDTSFSKFGVPCNTEQYEKNLLQFLKELFTSELKSELGYTFANHPALGAVEFANERTNAVTAADDYRDAYARFVRTVDTMFSKYKPDCTILAISAVGGVGGDLIALLKGETRSNILGPIDGDIGVGKTTAHYINGLTWHFYQMNTETDQQYQKDIRNNGFSSRNTLHISENALWDALHYERDEHLESPLYKSDLDKLVIWNVESGICPMEKLSPHEGGFRWFKMNRKEKFEALMKWFVPALFATQDGEGGLGVSWAYKSDLPGVHYTTYPGGSKGQLLNVKKGLKGRIQFTASKQASDGWLNNMTIVITGPHGGWKDLGLKEGEKRRYEVSVVSKENRILELQNTVYSEPLNKQVFYTEYQLSHSPYPEEFKKMVNLLKSGPVSFGWIHYPKQQYEGIYIEVKNVGKWYTTEKGVLKEWN